MVQLVAADAEKPARHEDVFGDNVDSLIVVPEGIQEDEFPAPVISQVLCCAPEASRKAPAVLGMNQGLRAYINCHHVSRLAMWRSKLRPVTLISWYWMPGMCAVSGMEGLTMRCFSRLTAWRANSVLQWSAEPDCHGSTFHHEGGRSECTVLAYFVRKSITVRMPRLSAKCSMSSGDALSEAITNIVSMHAS